MADIFNPISFVRKLEDAGMDRAPAGAIAIQMWQIRNQQLEMRSQNALRIDKVNLKLGAILAVFLLYELLFLAFMLNHR